MDRILIILKKENGPRASSAPALGLNTIIFKHVYWYIQQTQVSVYRTIGPLFFCVFFCGGMGELVPIAQFLIILNFTFTGNQTFKTVFLTTSLKNYFAVHETGGL